MSLSESYFIYKFEYAVIVNLLGLCLGSDTISTDRGRTSLATPKCIAVSFTFGRFLINTPTEEMRSESEGT